jgi:hypothetical protein
MATYTYTPLDNSNGEIRLLALLPGAFNDTLQITIASVPLKIPEPPQTQRISKKDLQATLPPRWIVVENVEGRYFFVRDEGAPGPGFDPQTDNSEYYFTTWTHPDANFDHSKHMTTEERPGPNFQPQYEALSYVWGSEETPETAQIRDLQSTSAVPTSHKTWKSLPIGASLAEALRHLRYADRPRRLWIDAICINQKDDQERSSQVQRMGQIYSMASSVVVWLGPEKHDSKLALETLQNLGAEVEVTTSRKRYRSPGTREPLYFWSSSVLPYSGRTWKAVYDLITRSWFSRLWIVQEIQLANSQAVVQCGHDAIPWPLFRRAAIVLRNKRSLPSEGFRQSLVSIEGIAYKRVQDSLFSLLSMSRLRECKDPRDKVYAILSIGPPEFAKKVRVDYKVKVEDLYRDVVLITLQAVGTLDFLTYCTLESALAGAPTWVPNWSKKPEPQRFTASGWLASGFSSAHAKYIAPNQLAVLGVQCDVVRTASEPLRGDQREVQTLIKAAQPPNMLQTSEIYLTGGSLFDAFVGLISVGRHTDQFTTVQKYEPLDRWKGVTRQWLLNDLPETEDSMSNLMEGTMNLYTGRTILTSDRGYLGLGPTRAQPGDRICVILGASYPMILRELPSRNFQVIGECYIQGLMDSEAVLGGLQPPWRIEYSIVSNIPKPTATFVNIESGIRQSEDPRLGDVLPEWEELPSRDTLLFKRFKHRVTGQILRSDPRLLRENLKARGVKVKKFVLI